jgi:hypothetical protein
MIFSNSCKKEESSSSQFNEEALFKKVALHFSKQRNNSEFNQLIEATKTRKGIEDFLLVEVLRTSAVGSRSVSSIEELNEIVSKSPMISISYPSFAFHNESFESHLSKIEYTVILLDKDEETGILSAFDSEGNLTLISSEFDESKRYCVVKYNEAYVAVDSKTKKTFFGDDVSPKLFDVKAHDKIGDYVFYTASELHNAKFIEGGTYPINDDEDDSGEGGGDRDPCLLPCERDCYKTKDELHRVKFNNKACVKEFESGFHLPEVELLVFYAIPRYNNGVVSVELISKDIFSHWKDITSEFSEPLGLEIATWTSDLGNRWQVLWIERDFWNQVQDKFTLGFSFGISNTTDILSASWEVTSMKKDKEIGRSLIEYCDPAVDEGEDYKTCSCQITGGFWFKEHIRD